MTTITLIGDIGGYEHYHVGDEAMLEQNLIQLRQLLPDARFIVVSQDTSYSAQQYNVEAVPYLDFTQCKSHKERKNYLATVVAAAEQYAQTQHLADQRLKAIEAIYQSDVLWVSGGGNLSSRFPEHLYERAALAKIAAYFKKSIVITGQTIGPDIAREDHDIVAELLTSAVFVGVREEDSYQLVRKQFPTVRPLFQQLDDAFFLTGTPPTRSDDQLPTDYIALTIPPLGDIIDGDVVLPNLVAQLDQLQDITGLDYVFIPHQRGFHAAHNFSDEKVGEKIRSLSHKPARYHVMPTVSNQETVWLTAHAKLIISVRYHPMVFGIAAHVPCIGIYTDSYIFIKLRGALAKGNLDAWLMSLPEAQVGGLLQMALDAWSKRDAIRAQLQQYDGYWQAQAQQTIYTISQALPLENIQQQTKPETASPPSLQPILPSLTYYWRSVAHIGPNDIQPFVAQGSRLQRWIYYATQNPKAGWDALRRRFWRR